MNVALRPNVNIISLCTGGAGLDLGVELAMPCARSVVLVEREAFAVSHLVAAMQQGLLAQAPVWSDVTTFNGRPWRGFVDGVIGGIPCQPHSLAGKRLGEDDERDLWFDARRIIVQSAAWFVLIENVRGMVTSGGFERVWRDLRRLGFEVEPGLFTASEVGASHQRERLFVLAVADRNNQYGHWSGNVRPRRRGESSDCRYDVGHADDAGLEGCRQSGECARERLAGSDGCELVNASGYGRGERRPEPELRRWRDSAAGAGSAMGYAIGRGHDGRPYVALGRSSERTAVERPSGGAIGAVADSEVSRSRRLSIQPGRQVEAGRDVDWQIGLFPPGPSDLHSWRSVLERAPQLEPAFRRVADGLASRLDIARVDRLRMLGNGVVSLEGAYAFRALATRLAARGAAGATRLVRMMNASEAAIQEQI